ncbi:MAG: hypothetical protein R3F59_24280 [Myxococcota bacterium]
MQRAAAPVPGRSRRPGARRGRRGAGDRAGGAGRGARGDGAGRAARLRAVLRRAPHDRAPPRGARGGGAIGAALSEAAIAPAEVDVVSVHGTGTRYNDAMEAHALRAVFDERPLAVHGVKGVVGHLLGAAGALECVEVVHALATGAWPAPLTDVDPELPWAPDPVRVGPPRVGVVTSSAFGGINAAAVLALPDPGAPERPVGGVQVEVLSEATVTLAPGQDLREAWPEAPPRALRLDRYGKVGLWAVSEALAALGERPEGEIGVVLWTGAGCREADLAHHERVVREGAGRASRLWFAATVPSVPASEAAVAHELRGPQLVFVGGDDVSIAEAERLLRHGRARCLVALSCDAPAPSAVATASARVLVARRG